MPVTQIPRHRSPLEWIENTFLETMIMIYLYQRRTEEDFDHQFNIRKAEKHIPTIYYSCKSILIHNAKKLLGLTSDQDFDNQFLRSGYGCRSTVLNASDTDTLPSQ